MPLIEWNAKIEVGYDLIDTQHKRLVDIINTLYDAMESGKGHQHVGQTLTELVDYTQMHFSTEEDLMTRHGYSEIEAHHRRHNDLLARVRVLQRDFDAGKLTVTMDTMSFLQTWLLDHIMAVDKKLAAFLNEPK